MTNPGSELSRTLTRTILARLSIRDVMQKKTDAVVPVDLLISQGISTSAYQSCTTSLLEYKCIKKSTNAMVGEKQKRTDLQKAATPSEEISLLPV